MALGGRDVLKLVVDADSAGAVKEFDKLGKQIKSTVGDADKEVSGFTRKLGSAFDGLAQKSPMVSGIFDKLGVSGQQAAGMIATAIPAAGLAAAAGIGVFAGKSIGHFRDTALAADKFRDASGLSIQDASKWIAVADDVGVGAGTMQSAFVKMEKAISTNRAAFGDLVATTASGATDLSATFLNVITHLQGIEDPIQRASEASKLFGRGFAEVSEIITTDADKLKASLAGVEDFQIVNDEQVEKAREFDFAMDALAETMERVKMVAGESIIPIATGLANLVVVADGATQKVGGVAAAFDTFAGAVVPGYGHLKTFLGALDQSGASMDGLKTAADFAGGSFGGLATATASAETSQRLLTQSFGDFEGRAAGLGDAMDDYATATAAADAATLALTNSILGLVSGEHAIHAAQQEVIESAERANEVNADGTATMLQKQIADDRAVQSALKLAEANRVQAEATGDADAGQEAFIATLQHLSGTASPAVRTQLEGVIAKLRDVGAQHPEPTLSVNDQASGPIRSASQVLAEFGRTSSMADIGVNDNATSKIREAIRLGQIFAGSSYVADATLITTRVFRQHGGPIPGGQSQAVPIIAHGGEYVLSADVVDRIKKGAPSRGAQGPGPIMGAGGGTGRAFNVTINTGVGDPVAIGRAVKQAIAAAERVGVN